MKCPSKKTISVLLASLHTAYPNARPALVFHSPLELLIATILSAQCTDVRVNQVTPALFKKYTAARDYACADLVTLQEAMRSVNFYKTKARNIINACAIIDTSFSGKVPSTMEQLLMLPGVARKTANVILHNAFHKTEGIVVDTHMLRVTNRLGLTQNTTPEKVEQDLMHCIPKKEWGFFGNALVLHGRAVCKARNPLCEQCCVRKICPVFKK